MKDKPISMIDNINFSPDNPLTSWLFNVRDCFKSKSQEEIKSSLKGNAIPCAVMMSHINGDFNFGSVIRSANGFNVERVFYFGKKKFDRRGALGTYHYIDVTHLSSLDEIKNLKEEYCFVALENNIDRRPTLITDFTWPRHKKPIILIGEEGKGLQEDILNLCDFFIEIPILGSVRSFNAAVAASIAIYDFSSKLQKTK